MESLEGDAVSIEVKDSNRPDIWSVEGIARALRYQLGTGRGRQISVGGRSATCRRLATRRCTVCLPICFRSVATSPPRVLTCGVDGGPICYARNGGVVYTSITAAGAYPYSVAAALTGASAAVTNATSGSP